MAILVSAPRRSKTPGALLAADDAHSQCMDGVPWYGVPGCWAALAMDVMACTVDLIDDVLIPIG